MVDNMGTHALHCRRSAGRFARHNEVNQEIRRILASLQILSRLEPPHLTTQSAVRPDGKTLVVWKNGKYLAWDATIVDTLKTSQINRTSIQAGAAAAAQEQVKISKYSDLPNEYVFYPIAFETLGSMGPQTRSFLSEIRDRFKTTFGPRSQIYQFFHERVSLSIVRNNTASWPV